MYQNVIGRVAQRSYFVVIVLGPIPNQRGKVGFRSIKSSICFNLLGGGGSCGHFHLLGGGGGGKRIENKNSGGGGGMVD